jgi:hypothetical protein
MTAENAVAVERSIQSKPLLPRCVAELRLLHSPEQSAQLPHRRIPPRRFAPRALRVELLERVLPHVLEGARHRIEDVSCGRGWLHTPSPRVVIVDLANAGIANEAIAGVVVLTVAAERFALEAVPPLVIGWDRRQLA